MIYVFKCTFISSTILISGCAAVAGSSSSCSDDVGSGKVLLS